jgi:cell division topological specificity factor
MKLINYIRSLSAKKPQSAALAKERLKIIISHERVQQEKSEDFLPKLQQEILEVISKYVDIDKDQVKVELDKVGDRSVLELNVILPQTLSMKISTRETATENA